MGDIDPLLENPRYRTEQKLGTGSFGFVLRARSAITGHLVAIKCIKREDVNAKYVESEIVNHSLLRHPHVIQFKEVFLTSKHVCIVMEHANGDSLFQYVQRHLCLNEDVARWFFQQLMIGVDYCHKKGVANRDIKLENTLLQNVRNLPLPLLKICDFGYSKAEFKSAPKSKVGTLTYMAPEVLKPQTYDGKVADIWSCGVMLYVMLFGAYPFHISAHQAPGRTQPDILQLYEDMMHQRYYIPRGANVSPECLDLLRSMLLPVPSARLTIDGIMRHPWFLKNLPAGDMVTKYLTAAPPPGQQSTEDIKRVIAEAMRPQISDVSPDEDDIPLGYDDDNVDTAAYVHSYLHSNAVYFKNNGDKLNQIASIGTT